MATDTVRDLKLDITGDFAIVNGDLVLTSGLDAIRQSLMIRLEFFQGEWFLDITAGLPYLQEILGVKNPNPNVLDAVFRKAILATPGITSINTLTITLDRATRRATVALSVNTDLGLLDLTQVI